MVLTCGSDPHFRAENTVDVALPESFARPDGV